MSKIAHIILRETGMDKNGKNSGLPSFFYLEKSCDDICFLREFFLFFYLKHQ